jgi:transcriptional regulator with XRE-family HTH domain
MGVLDSLGDIISNLRLDRNLTLQELSENSGVSPAMLSQIERGLTNPSFLVLYKLSTGLKVPVSMFFSGFDPNGIVVRRNERRKLSLPSQDNNGSSELIYELLSPGITGRLELLWIEYGPGTDTEAAPFSHQGEECGVIIEGQLIACIGEDSFILEKGDSIYLNSTIPHWFKNQSEKTAVMVWAVTPPSF